MSSLDQIRIAILDKNGTPQGFIDNYLPGSATFYDDILHEYLEGAASVFSFSSLTIHKDHQYLIVGNKIAFRANDRDYYFNIVIVEREESYITVEAYSTSFELLNEQAQKFVALEHMTFEQYLNQFDFEDTLSLNLCEVDDVAIKYEWPAGGTVLSRLYDLAAVFSAELEFIPILNDDYTLNTVVLNVYKAHTDEYQGMGMDKTDVTLIPGVNISPIRKTSDMTYLYTALALTGTDGLLLTALSREEYDADGNVEFYTNAGDPFIRAVQARDRFPSNNAKTNDRYIVSFGNYETEDIEILYKETLWQLRRNCVPRITYEVKGFVDANIGDTVYMEDSEFVPTLYLKARVYEQQTSFTNPSRNKTIFSNFKELESRVNVPLTHTGYSDILSTTENVIATGSDGGAFTPFAKAIFMDSGKVLAARTEVTLPGTGDGEVRPMNTLNVASKCFDYIEYGDARGFLVGYMEGLNIYLKVIADEADLYQTANCATGGTLIYTISESVLRPTSHFSMCKLANGSVLLFITETGSLGGAAAELKVLKSTTGNIADFTYLSSLYTYTRIRANNQGYNIAPVCKPAVLANGRIVVIHKRVLTVSDYDMSRFRVMISDDNGSTWVIKYEGSSSLTDAIMGTGTRTTLVVENGYGSFIGTTIDYPYGNAQQHLLSSVDGGNTWTRDTTFLNTVGNDCYYFDFCHGSDGFLYRAECLLNELNVRFYKTSSDRIINKALFENYSLWDELIDYTYNATWLGNNIARISRTQTGNLHWINTDNTQSTGNLGSRDWALAKTGVGFHSCWISEVTEESDLYLKQNSISNVAGKKIYSIPNRNGFTEYSKLRDDYTSFYSMINLNDKSALAVVCDPGNFTFAEPYVVKVIRSSTGNPLDFLDLSTIFTQNLTATPSGYSLPYSVAMPGQLQNGRIIVASTIVETVVGVDVAKVAIFVSDDNGVTWSEKWRGNNTDLLNGSTFVDNINVIENSLNNFVFITGDNNGAGSGKSILYSTDGGDTWTLDSDFANTGGASNFELLAFKVFDDNFLYRIETTTADPTPILYRQSIESTISLESLETFSNWTLMDNQGTPPDRAYWNQFVIGPSGTFHLFTEDGQTAANVTLDFAFVRKPTGVIIVPGIDSEDERLITTSKTLVGATNELATTTVALVETTGTLTETTGTLTTNVGTLTTTTGTLTTDVGTLQTLYSGDLLSFLEAMNGGP